MTHGAHAGEGRHSALLILVPPGSKKQTMLQIKDASVIERGSGFERQRDPFHQHAKLRPIRELRELQGTSWGLRGLKRSGQEGGRGGEARAFGERTPRPHIAVRHRKDRLDLMLPPRLEP